MGLVVLAWYLHFVEAFCWPDVTVRDSTKGSTMKLALLWRCYATDSFASDDNGLEKKWLEWIRVSLTQCEHAQDTNEYHIQQQYRRMTLKPLLDHKGFCNTLCLVQESNNGSDMDSRSGSTVAIFKIYSDIAKARRRVSGLEDCHLDEYLGELGLGPRVYGSSKDCVLMEYLESGLILNQDMMTTRLLKKVATSLAKLHTLKLTTPQQQQQQQQRPHSHGNMLWDSIDVLLDHVRDYSMKTYFQDQIDSQRTQLERLGLPLATIGHGDLKASNVMCLHTTMMQGDCIRFIDLETAGVHYRAFDLAKFFRDKLSTNNGGSIENIIIGGNNYDTASQSQSTRNDQIKFLQTYLGVVSVIINGSDSIIHDQDVESLRLESTWLEAAIFFYASRQPKEWKTLAEQRLEQYTIAMRRFPSTLETFLGQNKTVICC